MSESFGSRVALLVGVIVALLWTATPTRAQVNPLVEALGIEVTTGYGAAAVNGPWTPVAVRMAPRRPVRATLDVSVRGSDGQQTQSREIELRGGTTAVYRFVVPSGGGWVTVQEPGSPPVSIDLPASDPTSDDAVIGLLGSDSEPPPVQHQVTGRSATWAPVDAAWLALGARALQTLSGVIVEQTALAGLDDAALRALAAAVSGGMDLVVVASDPGPVDLQGLAGERVVEVTERVDEADLPALHTEGPAWRVVAADIWPGGDPETTVAVSLARGRGRVNVVTVAPGPGPTAGATRLWSLLALGRAAPAFADDMMPDVGPAAGTAAQLSQALSDGADSEPAIPWLAVFLAAYIVVVGPVCGLILARRRRPELTWVAVPAVTTVFTLAAVLAVPGARPAREERATVRWWLDGAGEQIMLAGVRAPTAGVRDLRLPGDDWLVRTMSSGADGAQVRTSDGDTTVALSLPSLALGGVIAHRSLAEAPPLEVDATVTGDEVAVDVRNAGTQRLSDVAVRAGAARRPVGALDPGASTTVTFAADALPDVSPHATITAPSGGAGTADGILASDVLAPEPGIVWALGTIGAADDGRGETVAVGRRPAAADGAALTPLAIDRTVLGDTDSVRPGTFMIEGGSAVVRFRLPAETTPAELEDRLGDTMLEVWDWRAEAWTGREEAFEGGVGASDRVLSPTGELYVRSAGGAQQFDFATSSVGQPGATAQETTS